MIPDVNPPNSVFAPATTSSCDNVACAAPRPGVARRSSSTTIGTARPVRRRSSTVRGFGTSSLPEPGIGPTASRRGPISPIQQLPSHSIWPVVAPRGAPRATATAHDGTPGVRTTRHAPDPRRLTAPFPSVPPHGSPAPPPPASRSPMIPATINPMQTSRTTVAGSRNSTIPSTDVPTVPIPVQTAYAVPIGSDLTPRPSSPMLAIIDATVRTVGQSRVNPSVYFRPTAHPISNSPATTRIPQAIPGPLCSRSLPHVLPRLGLHLNPDLQQVGRGLGLRREQLRRAKERLAQRGRFHIHHLVALPRVAVPNRHPVPSHGSLRAG